MSQRPPSARARSRATVPMSACRRVKGYEEGIRRSCRATCHEWVTELRRLCVKGPNQPFGVPGRRYRRTSCARGRPIPCSSCSSRRHSSPPWSSPGRAAAKPFARAGELDADSRRREPGRHAGDDRRDDLPARLDTHHPPARRLHERAQGRADEDVSSHGHAVRLPGGPSHQPRARRASHRSAQPLARAGASGAQGRSHRERASTI